jgi:hypothetical protein
MKSLFIVVNIAKTTKQRKNNKNRMKKREKFKFEKGFNLT